MEGIPQCDDHPPKPLLFWCRPCRKMVCGRCKKAIHEGHPSTDIDKAATEKRETLEKTLRKFQRSIDKAKSLLCEKSDLRISLDRSVKETKRDVKLRAAKVKQWIDSYEEETLRAIDDFAERHGREEMSSDISNIEDCLQRLEEDASSVRRVLGTDVTHHEVLRQFNFLSQLPTAFTLKVPLHRTYVFTPDTLAVPWERSLARFIGTPHLAESSSQRPSMAVALQRKLSTKVMAVHVMSNEHVCVVFSDRDTELPTDAADSCPLSLGVLNQESQLVLKRRLPEDMKRPLLASTSNNKILVACSLTGTKETFDAGSWESGDKENITVSKFLCCFKVDVSKKTTLAQRLSKSKSDLYKIFEVSTDTTKVLFTVQTEHPKTVVADKSGEHFAVIQNHERITPIKTVKRSSSEVSVARTSSVAVFQNPGDPHAKPQPPLLTFRPEGEEDFRPNDVCFYRHVDEDVLMVAGNSGVYMVPYEREGLPCKILFYQGSPLLETAVTALNTDSEERLWMGCQNGNILNWLPTDEVFSPYENAVWQEEPVDDVDTSNNTSSSSESNLSVSGASPPAAGLWSYASAGSLQRARSALTLTGSPTSFTTEQGSDPTSIHMEHEPQSNNNGGGELNTIETDQDSSSPQTLFYNDDVTGGVPSSPKTSTVPPVSEDCQSRNDTQAQKTPLLVQIQAKLEERRLRQNVVSKEPERSELGAERLYSEGISDGNLCNSRPRAPPAVSSSDPSNGSSQPLVALIKKPPKSASRMPKEPDEPNELSKKFEELRLRKGRSSKVDSESTHGRGESCHTWFAQPTETATLQQTTRLSSPGTAASCFDLSYGSTQRKPVHGVGETEGQRCYGREKDQTTPLRRVWEAEDQNQRCFSRGRDQTTFEVASTQRYNVTYGRDLTERVNISQHATCQNSQELNSPRKTARGPEDFGSGQNRPYSGHVHQEGDPVLNNISMAPLQLRKIPPTPPPKPKSPFKHT